MALTAPAIIGIVALLLMCIPGVKWLLKTYRKIRSRQNKSSNRNTVLPLSDRSSPIFGPSGGPTIPGSQGFVALSISAAVFWPPVDLPSRRSGRPLSHATDHQPE
ncbi:hypothetical protein F4803DRAFT_557415 [Xylaria telfairii]|nr:hypothetical protein F4803DRAFT_557415 [Xylaria telfairii]